MPLGRATTVVAVTALLWLAGCSSRSSTTPSAASSVTAPATASTPAASSSSSASASPTPSSTSTSSTSAAARQFQNAVTFARAVENGDLDRAEQLVAKKSTAADYVGALQAVQAARKINGENSPTGVVPTVSSDAGKKTVTISYATGSHSTWSHFSYDSRQRLTSWRSGSTRLSALVATRSDSAKAFGTTVSLAGAYRAANGDLYVVADFKAATEVALNGAVSYRLGGRTKQSSDSSTLADLKKGKKTSAYYVFTDSRIGGRITIPINNPGYTAQASVTLAVR